MGEAGAGCFSLDPWFSGFAGRGGCSRKSFNPARTGARGGATRDSRGAHRDHGGFGHGGAGDVPLGSLRSGRGGEVSAGPGSRGNGRESRSAPGGRTTVEDRRAVGSRAVARGAAREGSDGSRRGEHDTGVPRVSPRSLRARAVVTSPQAPRAKRRRQAVRWPRSREARERARGGEKEWEESAARGCAPWRLPWSEGPGGWRRLGLAPRPWRSWRPTSYDVQRQAAEGARLSGLKGWPGRLRRRTKIYGGNLTEPSNRGLKTHALANLVSSQIFWIAKSEFPDSICDTGMHNLTCKIAVS